MDRWRLLLVDDHALFREGLAGLFAYQDDFVVVGEAGDAETALSQTAALRPDIVLMDIDMPGADGIATTRRLRAEFPDVTVVMLTVHDATAELLDQLRGLKRGEAAITRRMATRILEEFQRGQAPADSRDGSQNDLTARELEVLELVADRLSNKEIAARLFISEHTVKNHLKNILSKLHLRSRRQAADYGRARGWVRPGETA